MLTSFGHFFNTYHYLRFHFLPYKCYFCNSSIESLLCNVFYSQTIYYFLSVRHCVTHCGWGNLTSIYCDLLVCYYEFYIILSYCQQIYQNYYFMQPFLFERCRLTSHLLQQLDITDQSLNDSSNKINVRYFTIQPTQEPF